jgi:hypothetical protein
LEWGEALHEAHKRAPSQPPPTSRGRSTTIYCGFIAFET